MNKNFQTNAPGAAPAEATDLSLVDLDGVAGGLFGEIFHEMKELMNNNTGPACGWLVCSDGSK